MLEVRKIVRSCGASHEALTARLKRLEAAGERIVHGGQTHKDIGSWEILDWDTDERLAYGNGGPDEYEAAKKRLNVHHMEDLEKECYQEPSETPGIPPSLSEALDRWVSSGGTPYEEIAAVAEMTVREVADSVEGFRKLYI